MNLTNVYICQKNKFVRYLLRTMVKNPNMNRIVSRYFKTLYSKLVFYNVYSRFPNFKEPTDFNEKLLKLKLNTYQHNQLIADCADKYKVRFYLEQKGYSKILNELYAVYEKPEDIDFSSLPNKFVIKMNHGSGYNIICKDKETFDTNNAIQLLKQWDKEDYGLDHGEWHYSNIKHKIIIEKYIDSLANEEMLIDYKFNCFKGKVHSIFVCYDRTPESVQFDIYTPDWIRTDAIKSEFHPNRRELSRPKHLQEMISIAEDLSLDFDYVRVDLYDVQDSVLFGEFTFSPHSCVLEYCNQDFIKELGRKL